MKFRPSVQLRFRDPAQYNACKNEAAEQRVSLNEWVLAQIEKCIPQPPVVLPGDKHGKA